MEGPTPDWANVDDYATLEEVFESPDFGHPLPAAAATAGLGAALASTPGTHLLRNRAIALTSVLAASLSVVLGLLFTGPASTPVLTAQHAPPARAGHGAGPVPVASPIPPAGRAGATTAPTTPPSPSNLGGSQLASSSPGQGQNTTLGTAANGAAPATPAPTATLTVLTNNPAAPITPITPFAPAGSTGTTTTTTTTTAPPRPTTSTPTPTVSPPRPPITTTTPPSKNPPGGASGGSGSGSGNSGGSPGCDCMCYSGNGTGDGGAKVYGTASSTTVSYDGGAKVYDTGAPTTAAPERMAPPRLGERGRAGS
jgi:hypothetical protein